MPKLIVRLLRRLESLRLVRRDGDDVPQMPPPVVGIKTSLEYDGDPKAVRVSEYGEDTDA